MKTINKKKVAIIGLKGLPAFGGAARVGENIIDALYTNYDITVYSISSHAKKNNNAKYRQIIFNGSADSEFATLVYYLKSLIHSCLMKNYDLIQVHHNAAGLIIPFLRLKYSVILVSHGILFDKKDLKFNRVINFLGRISEKMALRYSNIIICVSKYDAVLVRKRYSTNVVHIPNGLKLINRPKVEKQDYYVFSAARIFAAKGLHLLLNALQIANLREKKLLIIGNIDYRSDYYHEIEQSLKGLNVEFLGLIQDRDKLHQIIEKAKLFIFPSTYEAMSMMFLEVVSLKVPVVASDIIANTSIFSENEVIFFKSDDALNLSQKLLWAENVDLQVFADNAYDRILREYQIDKIAEKYREIHGAILGI